MSGWVKLHKSILRWKHYKNKNVRMTLIHCLLRASYDDFTYKGELVKSGCGLYNLREFSEDIGITFQQVRTAMNILVRDKEVVLFRIGRQTLFHLVKWDRLQNDQKEQHENNTKITNKITKEITRSKPSETPLKSSDTEHQEIENNKTNNKQNNTKITRKQQIPPIYTYLIKKKEERKKANFLFFFPFHFEAQITLEYLSMKTGATYKAASIDRKPTGYCKKLVHLLEKGYTVEDLLKVVEHKCSEWLESKEMRKQLTPNVLFDPIKFEAYLDSYVEPVQKIDGSLPWGSSEDRQEA